MADVSRWLKERRKAIIAFVQAVAQVVNAFLPAYSTEVKAIVATVVAGLGVLAVHRVRNQAPKRSRSK